ncbi:hypothetical protein D3C71_1854210 [compost metagenome]
MHGVHALRIRADAMGIRDIDPRAKRDHGAAYDTVIDFDNGRCGNRLALAICIGRHEQRLG